MPCGEVRHYENECKNRKNNDLIKTLGILNYFEFSHEETPNLTLENNNGIVEITVEEKYEESDREETSHMMESSSTSPNGLQWEEFTANNKNEEANAWRFGPSYIVEGYDL